MRRDERTQHRPPPFHSQHIRLLSENTCRRSLCLLEFYRDKIHRLCRGVPSSQKISGTTLIFREPCGLSLIKIKIKIIFSLRLGLATVWATGNKFIKIILICRCGVRVFGRRQNPAPTELYTYHRQSRNGSPKIYTLYYFHFFGGGFCLAAAIHAEFL